MDEEHCVIAVPKVNLRDSYSPQINAVTTSFLYVLSLPAVFLPLRPCGHLPFAGGGVDWPARFRPSLSTGLRRYGNDGAKVRIFLKLAKKDFFSLSVPC